MDTHFVSIELHDQKQRFPSHLALFLYGSSPLLGSWDSSRAIEMNRVAEHVWELELVIPPCCEKVEFNFLVKDHDDPTFQKVEEHNRRVLLDGSSKGNAESCVMFRRLAAVEELELQVFVNVERMSPSSLAMMWKALKGDFKSNTSQAYTNSISKSHAGTVAIAPKPSPPSLKGDFLEHEAMNYESKAQYHIDNTTNPESLHQHVSISSMQPPESRDLSKLPCKSISSIRSVSVQDLVVLGAESENLNSVRLAVDGCIKSYSSEKSLMSVYSGDELVNNKSNMDDMILNADTEEKVMFS